MLRHNLDQVRQLLVRRRMQRVGGVRFGDLRRITPISQRFGYDRGLPVDRHYIESFLAAQADVVRGEVLEIGDNTYTVRFGGSKVTSSDILHIDGENPHATIVADLSAAPQIQDARFDCIICTQTLHLIFDLEAAIHTLHRILKPGGALLVTVPGITHVSFDRWGNSWYWAFTDQSVRCLFAQVFPATRLTLATYGNVLTSASFLYGLAADDLRPGELAAHDPHYQLIIAVRADKPDEL